MSDLQLTLRLKADAKGMVQVLDASGKKVNEFGRQSHEAGLASFRAVLNAIWPVGPHVIHRNHAVHLATRNDARIRFAPLIIPTLTDPFEIWAVDYGDHLRLSHMGLFRNVSNG